LQENNNIRDLQNLFFDQKLAAQEWFAVATKLEKVAILLREHTLNPDNKIEIRYQEYMFWGFSFENLFKGILSLTKSANGESSSIKKKGIAFYDTPTHDLSKLANLIDFKISIEEKLALDFLTQATVYLGRYPSPMRSNKQAIYFQSNFDEIILGMLDRLKEIKAQKIKMFA